MDKFALVSAAAPPRTGPATPKHADSMRVRATAASLVNAALLLLLSGLGWAIRTLAARAPRPSDAIARAALANLHRPGASTGTLVTALGFGLAAFVLLAAVQTSLDGNIRRSVPARAPDYFVLDVPKDDYEAMRGLIEKRVPGSVLDEAPMLRGRLVRLKDVPVEDVKAPPEAQWVLNGDRGLSYADEVPSGSQKIWASMWVMIA